MNKLKNRFYIILILTFTLSFLGLHFFWIEKIESLFQEIEMHEIQKNTDQINALVDLEFKGLILKVKDWATWDHTYNFIRGKRPQYIKENFSDPAATLKLIQVNFFVYLDEKMNVKLSIFTDKESSKELPFAQNDLDKIKQELLNGPSERTDFLKINNQPYMVIFSKIRTTDSKLTSGYFVSGRLFSDEILDKFEKINQLNLTLLDNAEAQPSVFKKAEVSFYPLIKDYKKQPFVKIQATQKRTIYQFWTDVKMQLLILVSGFFTVCFVLIMSILKTTILRPIKHLVRELNEVQNAESWKNKTIGKMGIFEFDLIAADINQLLRHIEATEYKVKNSEMILMQAEKFKSLGEMASGVRHEINNPLAVISGHLHLLKRDFMSQRYLIDPPSKYVASLEKSLNMVERIGKIIRSLKNISRSNDSDELVACSLNQCIADAIELAKDRFYQNSIRLEFKSDIEAEVLGIPSELLQVLINLLNNSFDAIVHTDNPWVNISIKKDANTYQINVTDSGPGINSDITKKMMDPFFTTKAIGQGTGLGLSISKSLVEKMGGQFYYELVDGHTSFVLRLKSYVKSIQAA